MGAAGDGWKERWRTGTRPEELGECMWDVEAAHHRPRALWDPRALKIW